MRTTCESWEDSGLRRDHAYPETMSSERRESSAGIHRKRHGLVVVHYPAGERSISRFRCTGGTRFGLCERNALTVNVHQRLCASSSLEWIATVMNELLSHTRNKLGLVDKHGSEFVIVDLVTRHTLVGRCIFLSRSIRLERETLLGFLRRQILRRLKWFRGLRFRNQPERYRQSRQHVIRHQAK
jgi:hypothetical protein